MVLGAAAEGVGRLWAHGFSTGARTGRLALEVQQVSNGRTPQQRRLNDLDLSSRNSVPSRTLVVCSRALISVGFQSLIPVGIRWEWRLTLPQVRRYLTFMKTTVSSKGQIVLPAEFRQMDRVEPGQEFEVERLDRGDYRLVRRAAPHNEGAIDWLLACPQKDFFVPIDSESTDAL